MPDNWGFVLAAYGLAAVVLIGYWRMLVRREKELAKPNSPPSDQLTRGSKSAAAETGERSQVAPASGHPRSKPASRHPLQ